MIFSPLTLTVNNPTGLDDATLNSLIAQATEAITQQQIIQNPPQLTPSQQPIITTQPQPHKAQLVNTQQQIIVTPKHSPAMMSTAGNQIVGNQQLLQGNQQMLQGNQQLLQGNQQMLQGSQQILQGNQQILQGNQQMIHGSQQLMQGNQQIITVSNNQPVMMTTPKPNVHRVSQQSRSQMSSNQSTVVTDNKTSVIQSSSKSQPMMRQVITRQPVMVGNTKIGDKEMVVSQPIIEKPVTPKKVATPPLQQIQPQQQSSQDETPWICHWRGCGKTFENAGQVFTHAAHVHCPTAAAGEAPCLWADCDRVPRKTFALLNHIGDKHCTPQALKAIYNSRRHSGTDGDNKPVSLGYPPNAALAALNKHANDMFNPRELMDENEGPVTKSIRLTAALILRNIVIYSNTGRRQLRSYEAHLATIALSSVEASRTIAQVLFDMNNI